MNDKNQGPGNARKIALNGLLTAVTVILLYAESVLPTSKLSLYVLSSFATAAVVLTSGVKSGFVFYAAASILSLIIIPDKIGLAPYIIFFGIYALIKYYIERINNIAVEYIVKLVYFNICLGAGMQFLKLFFPDGIRSQIPLWGIIIGAEVVFVVYDYVFTLFVQYFNNKLRRYL